MGYRPREGVSEVGFFWRLFAERFPDQGATNDGAATGPDNELTGYETYQKLFLYFGLTQNSVKDSQLIMTGLRDSDARAISEQSFVSYEFYNFKAHSGLARDLFGHQLSKTEGDLNSEFFDTLIRSTIISSQNMKMLLRAPMCLIFCFQIFTHILWHLRIPCRLVTLQIF